MPMLFCLGQHGALRAIAERLLPGEKLFAYLDDLYVVCQPNPTESGTYTLSLGKNSGDTPKSAFTTGRLKCGTVEEP